MSTVIAMPYRESDPRRKELFDFTTTWLQQHHPDLPIHIGTSPAGDFNRGAAINNALSAADNWDCVIVHDADNISDPATLREAVEIAQATGKVVYPFETYTYLDEYTSNRIMADGTWFIAPELHPTHTFRTTVRHKHYSGIQVIPRPAYEAVGGYIQLTGWGAEDVIMDTLFDIYAKGSDWLSGGAFHLWHEANRNNPRNTNSVANHQIWNRVKAISTRPKPEGPLRKYLATIGHHIPGER